MRGEGGGGGGVKDEERMSGEGSSVYIHNMVYII